MFDCRGMDGKIRARCFSRRFFHMQGTIREWTEEKLEGGSSQILETSDLRAVTGVKLKLSWEKKDSRDITAPFNESFSINHSIS